MKRFFTLIIAASLLAGCATIHQAGSQPYRARGTDQAHNVSGQLEFRDALFTLIHDVTITIDGATVIRGELSSGGTGILHGTWKGRPIEADCTKVQASVWSKSYNVRCIVISDNERMASLTF